MPTIPHRASPRALAFAAIVVSANLHLLAAEPNASATAEKRTYRHELKKLVNPPPLLADYPEFVDPVRESHRYEAPPLIDEEGADLQVRAWRFSYNARGVIEMPNRLRGDRTAVIVVHPWGIDDGQGWQTPEPAGAAFQCTPERNRVVTKHLTQVVNLLLKSLRNNAKLVMYSLPGKEDPVRQKMYRSFRGTPALADIPEGKRELQQQLAAFKYLASELPTSLTLSADRAVIDYYVQFPALDPGPKYNNPGFWSLPVPVHQAIDVARNDVVIYDGEGYPALREFLRQNGVRHILLTGYNTDMCVCATTAGFDNLRQDFNVFLVGDATLATFPAQPTPAVPTSAAVAFASLKVLITQASWIQVSAPAGAAK
ncbi:MAG TPA: isochorismatase family protein [Planctomycetaceae bacterium]|nr:isochorismatase family protein [Planctomycetaceae bacterium]